MTRTYPRANTTQRGYGYAHQQLRKRLLPLAYGTLCPRCHQPMLKGQALDLDHEVPLALGGGGRSRMAHRYCNRAAGARLRNTLYAGRRRLPVTSRRW